MCIVSVLYFCAVFLTGFACDIFPTCDSCAGSVFANKTCRWCIGSSSCVSSKYRCHPSVSTISSVNCPSSLPIYPEYNDSLVRNHVVFYILAANRINNSALPSDVRSCFDKSDPAIRIVRTIYTTTFYQSHDLSAVVAVDDRNSRIILAFRSTVGVQQFISEGFDFALGFFEPFPFGGKVVRYYRRAYDDLLGAGLRETLDQTLKMYPFYQVLTCGHSMGGSLSTLFSLHISMIYGNPVVEYSLSGPRVGDEQFVRIHDERVTTSFRIIRRGDWIPDMPFRISEQLTIPFHTKREVFYDMHMTPDTYHVCTQADSQKCNRGAWLRTPISHIFMFDQAFHTFFLSSCE